MTISQLSDFCHSTNDYNNEQLESGALYYGVGEECGESLGQKKRELRDDNCHWTNDRVRKLTLEMMDMLWYALEIDRYLRLGVVSSIGNDTILNTLQRNIVKESDDISPDMIDRGYYLNQMYQSAATIVNGWVSCTPMSTFRSDTGYAVMKILASIASQLRAIGVQFDDAARLLVEKLNERVENNKIHGEGSER